MKKKEYFIDFEDFEERCKVLAKIIKSNKNIKDIYGVPKGGIIPAIRIAYIANLPITFAPHSKHTAIIDDVLSSGATRHSFGNFTHFFPLVDKMEENIIKWVKMWYY